jgi:hypothetical protein
MKNLANQKYLDEVRYTPFVGGEQERIVGGPPFEN